MRLDRLIITTMDRPELTQRAIDSFALGGLPVTIYDQSVERTNYTGIERLVGPPEVATMVDQFVANGFKRELVQWALVGGHGGYRNVALLDTIGQRILSTDDDTLCQFIGTLDQEPTFQYGVPEPYWHLFASRAEWEEWSLNLPRTTDVIVEHEKYVGESTQDDYRFCVVVSGLIGDSAASFNNNYMVMGKELAQLITNYEVLRDTREVMQVVHKATMCPGSTFLRTMNYSFDNSCDLPPFPPSGRGECGVFASVLRLINGMVVTYLPWGIVHVPPEGRRYTSMFDSMFFDEAFYIVEAGAGADSMEVLGHALMALDSMRDSHVYEMFVHGREIRNEGIREALRHLLDLSGPSRWHNDCRDRIARSERPDQVALETSVKMRQELVRYGELLLAWPKMRLVAGELCSGR